MNQLEVLIKKWLKRPFSFRIRLATNEDVFEIIQLTKEVKSDYGLDVDLQSADHSLLNIQEHFQTGSFLVAEEEFSGKIIACAGVYVCKGQIGIIDRLYVQRHHRRLGLGTELLGMFLQFAKEKQLQQIRINIPMRTRKGMHFFEKFGFAPSKNQTRSSHTQFCLALNTQH